MGALDNLRFAVQRRRGSAVACRHVDMVRAVERGSDGCEACLELGESWVHLRMCMTCGIVGCCNTSKNRHASRHAREARHPIARSVEPGEDWLWCFVDRVIVEA